MEGFSINGLVTAIILTIFAYHVIRGYRRGFIKQAAFVINTILSVILAPVAMPVFGAFSMTWGDSPAGKIYQCVFGILLLQPYSFRCYAVSRIDGWNFNRSGWRCNGYPVPKCRNHSQEHHPDFIIFFRFYYHPLIVAFCIPCGRPHCSTTNHSPV